MILNLICSNETERYCHVKSYIITADTPSNASVLIADALDEAFEILGKGMHVTTNVINLITRK